jgi:hypothetical protein
VRNSGFVQVLRAAALALLAVGAWFLGRYVMGLPEPKGIDAPATEFSAGRAEVVLARVLGAELPHPISSPENANVRSHLEQELAALHVPMVARTGLGCTWRPKRALLGCGTVTDLIATVQEGEGKAIVMLSHYDSVPAGPGAGDDGSGVAAVVESIRAMKARGIQSRHPILAVITDGEEAGLLGASMFLHDAKLRERVGAVVNVDSRGTRGASLLFQTSPGDGPLIDLYAHSVPRVETSSLFAVIYKLLPNDTDLTEFLADGVIGFNFAFADRVAQYHTPLDTRANLDPRTLQMQGDNLLGVTTALMDADFDALKAGHDDVYLTLFGLLPRFPAGWALPLALLALALVAYRARRELKDAWGILAVPPLLVVLAAAVSEALLRVARLVSGQPDPAYAHPEGLRIAFGLGLFSLLLPFARFLKPSAVWLWMALLAVGTAGFLPGLSPYFLFPLLIAAPVLLLPGELPVLVAALPAVVIFLRFAAMAEGIGGIVMHPLFSVPVVLGAMTLLPLLGTVPVKRLAIGAAVASLAVAIVAGLMPTFSATLPQRLSVSLVDDHVTNRAVWSAQTPARLPGALRAAASFGDAPQKNPFAWSRTAEWLAPAGEPRFDPPTAEVQSAPEGAGRAVILTLHGSDDARTMGLGVPNGSGLTAIEVGDYRFPVTEGASERGTLFLCASADCRTQSVTLHFSSTKAVDVMVKEQRFGLPVDGQAIAAARPPEAVPSQSGDTTEIVSSISVP